jgi:HK97 family phage major capsid protein
VSDTIAKIISEKHRRTIAAEFIRDTSDKDSRVIDLSFSSDTPCERWYGMEILDHAEKAVDLSRANDGGALLLDHDPTKQIGVIESATISGKKGRAKVRFSRSPLGEEIFGDVTDGIRRNVSVGYEIKEIVREKSEGKVDTYRVTRWTVLEISITSIPLDPSIGVGRQHQTNNPKKEMRILLNTDPAPGGGGVAAPAAPAVNVQEVENRGAAAERARSKEIRALAKKANLIELGEQFVDSEKSVEQFRTAALEQITGKPLVTAPGTPAIGMNETEIKRYSIVRAMNRLANKLPVDGLEKEVSDAVAKRTRRDTGGFLIPWDITNSEIPSQKRTLNINSQTAGGLLVGTEVGSMIELLRNKTVVASMGATTLSGLQGNLALPRQTGGATAYWLDETTAVTASDQAFGQLGLTPKRLAGLTKYTKQLLAQASIDVEGFVRNDLTTVLAIAKDKAAIQGLGAAGEPVGILNTTGVNSITFSGAPTWAKIVDFEKETDLDNALMGTIGYLSTPTTKAKWKTTVKASSTAVFLLDGDTVNGYKFASTNQFPTSGTLNQVIFGNWADLILADWDGIDVVVDPYSNADTNIVRIVITIMTDIGVRHAVSFCISSDSGAQ